MIGHVVTLGFGTGSGFAGNVSRIVMLGYGSDEIVIEHVSVEFTWNGDPPRFTWDGDKPEYTYSGDMPLWQWEGE